MKKYIVAVSGGVDSVVLLDMLSKQSDLELIVAHFDHGVRDDSAADAEFVAELARKYNLPFETKREELGVDASEELARDRRYEFLKTVAGKHGAQIVTAHHGDDVIETIAINLMRGTGWRGLGIMDSESITRPLTHTFKTEIREYAKNNNLQWREDSTNASDKYLRNRIRAKSLNLENVQKLQLLDLWVKQKRVKKLINGEVAKLMGDGPEYSRYFFINIDTASAMECLRRITNVRLTRPQMTLTLNAIKTILPNKTFQAGNGVKIEFTARNFTVELIE
jgi:tRNA(Ile)-lysidine synthase